MNLSEKLKVLRFLMEKMFSKDIVDELKGKYVIHWNYRLYQDLPRELLTFGLHVEEIYAKGNKLTTLPDWIKNMSHLTGLYLEGNRLTNLPDSICQCSLLDSLDLQNNQLTNLPDGIDNLRNLTILNLKGNNIRTLPKGFENLKALAILNLAQNGMNFLPGCICYLRSLQELILDDNNLMRLPRAIVQLPNLNFISVNKNSLEHLPLLVFNNHPSITFRQNPQLNYIQYDLACDLSRNSYVYVAFNEEEDGLWHLDITECMTKSPQPADDGHIYISTENHFCIKLPRELRYVENHPSHHKTSVPTLFELSLRESYEEIASWIDHPNLIEIVGEIWSIPSIGRHLKGGPTARCSNWNCSQALFTEAVMWAMNSLVSNGEGPTRTIASVLFFCSTKCSQLYSESHSKELSMKLNWTKVN